MGIKISVGVLRAPEERRAGTLRAEFLSHLLFRRRSFLFLPAQGPLGIPDPRRQVCAAAALFTLADGVGLPPFSAGSHFEAARRKAREGEGNRWLKEVYRGRKNSPDRDGPGCRLSREAKSGGLRKSATVSAAGKTSQPSGEHRDSR